MSKHNYVLLKTEHNTASLSELLNLLNFFHVAFFTDVCFSRITAFLLQLS